MTTEQDREALARQLEREFGSFLARWPADPDRFFGQAADGLIRAGWLRAVKADALLEYDVALIEGLADDMDGGFNPETLNLERRQIKRWLRERARLMRGGEA